MFVLKNAWLTIRRHLARSLVFFLACLAVAALTLVGATVVKIDRTARTSGYEAQTADAVITPKKGSKAKPLGWEEYSKYAQQLQPTLQYKAYFTETSRVGVEGLTTKGTFSILGISSKDAEPSLPYGTFRIIEGKGIDYTSQDNSGVQSILISEKTARANKAKVGDKVSLTNPVKTDMTAQVKVGGIYTYGKRSVPESAYDTIYTGYPVFANLELDTVSEPGSEGHDLHVAFVLSSPSDYREFIKAMRKNGLKESKYDISSPSLDRYEKQLKPVHQAAEKTRTGIILVSILGGLILLVSLFLMLKSRRNEIGMAVTIGIHKARLGWQFALETLLLSIPGLGLGLGLGALVSKPLIQARFDLGKLAVAADISLVWRVALIGMAVCAVMALVASLRVAAFKTSQLYTNDLEERA